MLLKSLCLVKQLSVSFPSVKILNFEEAIEQSLVLARL